MSDEQPPTLEGVTTAPMIYFDGAPVYGIIPGVGRITLEAVVQGVDAAGNAKTRRIVVAHLRGSAMAFQSLRRAIDGLELLARQPPEGLKPN